MSVGHRLATRDLWRALPQKYTLGSGKMRAGFACDAIGYGVYRDGRLLSVWSTEEQALSFCYPGWERYVLPLIGQKPSAPILSWVANEDGMMQPVSASS